ILDEHLRRRALSDRRRQGGRGRRAQAPGRPRRAVGPARARRLAAWSRGAPRGPPALPLVPAPPPEWKPPTLASVYALTKYVQERLTLTLAPAYGMEGVALRLWNVYGPGPPPRNPYTGV